MAHTKHAAPRAGGEPEDISPDAPWAGGDEEAVDRSPDQPGMRSASNGNRMKSATSPAGNAAGRTSLPPPPTTKQIALDFAALDRSGILTPHSARYRLAEELRVIKRRLLINAAAFSGSPINHRNVIMITSASPGEGKTFLAMNLAVSIELEIDRTVLLVDCDTVRSRLSRLLGVESLPGLSDLLVRPNLSLGDVLRKTNIDDLTILPAGSRIPHINEQMASQKMLRLIEDLATRYEDRIIILDSPPLLATTETSVLARLVGQIVLVVASGQTKQRDLQAAIELVDPSKIAGLVLNKSEERPETSYYENYFEFDQKYLPP